MKTDDADFSHYRHSLDKLPIHGHRGSFNDNHDIFHHNISDHGDCDDPDDHDETDNSADNGMSKCGVLD